MSKHAYIGIILGVLKSNREPQVMTTLVVADDETEAIQLTRSILMKDFQPEKVWKIDVGVFEVDKHVRKAANEIGL
jgi:hypothetical protein